jgi:enoyl-CoA hydratase/carnithine racemase
MKTPTGLREETLEPGVLRWVFDNPARRNAVSPSMLEWIAARGPELAGEVVILRGEGERAFTAGFDLTALAEQNRVQPYPPDAALIQASAAISRANATFIAALNGYVIGAGVELIACCDFRIACTTASLRVPAGKLGVIYHAQGLARIHASFGGTVARRLLLAGEKVEIADARASLAGLVEYARLDDEVLALARRIHEQAPRSVAGNRGIFRALELATALPEELLAAHESARREAYGQMAAMPTLVRQGDPRTNIE